MEEEESEEAGETGSSTSPVELAASYLAFAKRALRERWLMACLTAVVCLGLTVAVFIYLPRTYTSGTILMVQSSGVLDKDYGSASALAGATDQIMRRENLEAIVRDTRLIQKADERRPPLLKLKDKLIKSVVGEYSDKIKMAILVGSLETKLSVTIERGDLNLKCDWSDPRTAFEIVDAARESFLRVRHAAEMSAFEEKMAILDGHATRAREDVASLARQIKAAREEALEQSRSSKAATSTANPAAPAAPAQAVAVRRPRIAADARLPELQQKLTTLRAQLAEKEGARERRIQEEQAKLSELKLKFTPSHPQVITQEERVALAAQVPSELALLRVEVKDVKAEIEQREAFGNLGPLLGGPARAAASGGEALPAEVVQLMDRDDVDPALSTQLSSAVTRFGRYRDEIATGRVELDLAEAAFNRRYQVIVPAEVPNNPTKPKPAALIGGGFAATLLLSFLLPLLAQLRRGVIVERWQVHQLQLPVLAELRLPPYSGD